MTPTVHPTNVELADVLVQMADLLSRDEVNPYRLAAYHTAAAYVRDFEEPLAHLYATGGAKALTALPGIGPNLATHLGQYIESGRTGLHDRLMRSRDPVALLQTVPGVGRSLAERLVAEGITSLAELERAVVSGDLAEIEGIGPRRLEALRLQLNSILHRASRRRSRRVRKQIQRLAAERARAAAQRPALELVPTPDPESAPEPAALATIYPLFPPAAA